MALLSAQKVSAKKCGNFEKLVFEIFQSEKNTEKFAQNSGRDPPQSASEIKLSCEFCIL